MNWKYVKSLSSISLIDAFEKLTGYKFCSAYRLCVIEHNGGRPNHNIFNVGAKNSCVLKSFLSFNREDKENIWEMYEWCRTELTDKYIPFGIDNFGNLLCFDILNDNVVFIDMEKGTAELVSKDFKEFIDELL